MSYRNLEDIDQKIILTTIRLAGLYPPNHFSTREIASECRISEYVIFDHFKSKDNLIAESVKHISEAVKDCLINSVKENPTPEHAFFALIDFYLAHKDFNRFALNYCPAFPQYDKNDNFAFFESDSKKTVFPHFSSFKVHEGVSPFATWCFFIREATSFSSLLIEKRLPDNEKTRETMFNIVYHGFKYYKPE
ncbi:MAG: TetR/AcrR family transcriptional regulator [Bacilli bacterium]|jgi:AcrR family transcriptional regulator|nr:TetR/AcrR family transcriptional regulator [Bacilli bacterium]MCH4210986.1 TetR/AcrR family transcriptional regulator [Bacilli bacterium]MCH4228503.1 TetR/AcrR family transcriptional regulator [Bacilli bacterium]MCH4277785.1 TetR/AcrR family transcriptional regulator [Bacilli bacterium]MCI2054955.1 TetR/AcrR family transcriptional regulator [Bacilli bacterium]